MSQKQNLSLKKSAKEYLVLKEVVNLEMGFNMRASCGFVLGCSVYSNQFPEGREVLVGNLSDEIPAVVNGASMMGVMSLAAAKGNTLEIKIEGTDEAAKKFSEELKRGLNEEDYLYSHFSQIYREMRKTKETDYERYMGLRSLYKKETF
jgi:phosphotransferase system HPr-like phosphotransfer protein